MLDLCKDNGGKVVITTGNYRVSSLRMWSDTTLYLCSGARLEASEICEDYEIYEVPSGVELRTDMEMITQYYENRPLAAYRTPYFPKIRSSCRIFGFILNATAHFFSKNDRIPSTTARIKNGIRFTRMPSF